MSSTISRVVSTRYPQWCHVYAERLPSALQRDWDANYKFQNKITTYFSGRLPHCKEVITSTLLNFLGAPSRDVCDESAGSNSTTLRVSRPWPDGTKEALRVSLDYGIFDDWKFPISCGLEATVRMVNFPLALVGDTDTAPRKVAWASGFSLLTSVTNLHIYSLPLHTD